MGKCHGRRDGAGRKHCLEDRKPQRIGAGTRRIEQGYARISANYRKLLMCTQLVIASSPVRQKQTRNDSLGERGYA